MKHLQILTAKSLCIVVFLSISLYAFALDQDVQVDILTTKITTALKADKHADALPYFMQLEEMESSLKKPLPESFHFQYIKALSVAGDKVKALNKSEAYLSKYGKKGKYYSQVLEIISPLQIERDKTLKQLGQIEMVEIPKGSFMMGDNNSAFESEKPAHLVTVDYSFELGKYEVTQSQWQAVMNENPSEFKNCGANCPVENISWIGVQKFIQNLNALTGKQYRLPTEAEWEYACRAGTENQYQYCGSNNLDDIAWYINNSNKTTHPVGVKKSNNWGIHDMSGNVSEWVQDNSYDYDSVPSNSRLAWESGKKADLRQGRGGHFLHKPTHVTATVRFAGDEGAKLKVLGFRLARTIP